MISLACPHCKIIAACLTPGYGRSWLTLSRYPDLLQLAL